jgi:hypothetical protein
MSSGVVTGCTRASEKWRQKTVQLGTGCTENSSLAMKRKSTLEENDQFNQIK